MSGIASLLLARGIAVTGSDLKDSVGLERLRASGARVSIGHRADQLDDGGRPDAVVVSAAIPEANPELHRARKEGIRVLARAQVLAALMRGRRAVAVAGTHGKTTTTSMISVLLSRAGLDPSYVIGGDLNESGSGAFHGSGEILVAEADESDGSFLLYQPEIAVVTNVDDDHLDFYAGRDEIEAAFAAFVRGAANVVACWDDPGARRALGEVSRGLLRYGTGDDVDLHLDVEEVGQAGGRGTVRFRDERATLVLAVPGRHNLLNASAAMGVGLLLGVPMREAAEALRSFTGVRRRFERRGAAGGATFVDDYAHHPTEIAATLKAAMPSRRGRLLAVFQPHRFTRTQALWRALGESLSAADVVVFTEVYGAGERPIPGVTGKLLVE